MPYTVDDVSRKRAGVELGSGATVPVPVWSVGTVVVAPNAGACGKVGGDGRIRVSAGV